jgi:hypothetical protein
MGAKINGDKMKYVITRKSTILPPRICAGRYSFQKVERFFCLGKVVNYDDEGVVEIKARQVAAKNVISV